MWQGAGGRGLNEKKRPIPEQAVSGGGGADVRTSDVCLLQTHGKRKTHETKKRKETDVVQQLQRVNKYAGGGSAGVVHAIHPKRQNENIHGDKKLLVLGIEASTARPHAQHPPHQSTPRRTTN